MTTLKSFALAAIMMIASTASAATSVNPKTDKSKGTTTATDKRAHDNGRTVVNNYYSNCDACAFERGFTTKKPKARECNCRQCKKLRKELDKHMRTHHYGKQNRMTCRTCMEISHKLNRHQPNNAYQHNHR